MVLSGLIMRNIVGMESGQVEVQEQRVIFDLTVVRICT